MIWSSRDWGDGPEHELLASREDRGGDLVAFGRGHDERDVVGRLFEDLEQGVERRRRKHVHFVDDEDLEPVPQRSVARVLTQFADAVDPGVRRGVDLEDVG
jgi:hypothetical protein